jgi:hypothetical protein
MYHQVCYVIKPQSSLLEFLKAYKSASAFGSPEVWVLGTGGYGAPLPPEHALGVKFFWLAQFRSRLISQNVENHEEILERMMGQPPFHKAVFDRWWTLERYGEPREFDLVLSGILPDELSLVQDSGSPKIDGWLAKVEAMIRQGEFK